MSKGKAVPAPGYVSSDLVHFVGRNCDSNSEKYKVLENILSKQKLLPGGREGQGNLRLCLNKKLTSNEMLLAEAVCFADIPPRCLDRHTEVYGRFGIAFPKTFLVPRGACPVFYLPRAAKCVDHRHTGEDRKTDREGFFELVAGEWAKAQAALQCRTGSSDTSHWSGMANLVLWYFLAYCKFFDHTLNPQHRENYYMEREWRIIGKLCFRPDDVSVIYVPGEDYLTKLQEALPQYGEKVEVL